MNQHADALSRKPIALVALNSLMEKADLAEAQWQDPVLSKVYKQLQCAHPPPATGDWRKHPLKHYRQLWSKLALHDAIICCKVQSPAMQEPWLLVVVPRSAEVLPEDCSQGIWTSGHEADLGQIVRGNLLDRAGTRCGTPLPLLHKMLAHQIPWQQACTLTTGDCNQILGVGGLDILKFPPSSQGKQYVLVAQNHFSKWPFVQATRPECWQSCADWTSRATSWLITVQSWGKKTHTTLYHPMGDGLVKWMNKSYAQRERDWEEHLQRLLFLYPTTKHATTGTSPYKVLFGSNSLLCTSLTCPTRRFWSHWLIAPTSEARFLSSGSW